MYKFKIKNKLFQLIHMVKTIQKSIISQKSSQKRVRGIKTRINSNKSKKKVKRSPRKILPNPLDINYYVKSKIDLLLSEERNTLIRLKRIENSEFSELRKEESPKYKQEHRALAIIGLKDVIYQVIDLSQNNLKLDDDFIFSVISLYECYIRNSEKALSKNEMIKSLFSCLILIDKFKKVGVFSVSFFQHSNPTFNLDLGILSTVDLNLFPIKIYDYFNIFFLRISQMKKDDKKYQEYILLFKEVFIEFNFYFVFHENGKIKKPSINFISCLQLTYSFIKYNYLLENDIIKEYISHYKNIIEYNEEQEYFFAKEIIKESKYVYDDLISSLKVNKRCKEGLINNVNINCI